MTHLHLGADAARCWVCGASGLVLVRQSGLSRKLVPDDFSITDHNYGLTSAIYRCPVCGFLECPEMDDTLKYYTGLADHEYEATRHARLRQMRNLMGAIAQVTGIQLAGRRLLDVGAGSGILVEAAIGFGCEAQGIEPSEWLARQATNRNLPVSQGVLPHPEINGRFNLITMIDVIEHVSNPRDLLSSAAAHLTPGGVIVLVTPDVRSIVARLLGTRWWHYRLAHIGYFDKMTLGLLCRECGLEPVAWKRPGWVFPADYLIERLGEYIPIVRRLAKVGGLRDIHIPINLLDSLLVVAREVSKAPPADVQNV